MKNMLTVISFVVLTLIASPTLSEAQTDDVLSKSLLSPPQDPAREFPNIRTYTGKERAQLRLRSDVTQEELENFLTNYGDAQPIGEIVLDDVKHELRFNEFAIMDVKYVEVKGSMPSISGLKQFELERFLIKDVSNVENLDALEGLFVKSLLLANLPDLVSLDGVEVGSLEFIGISRLPALSDIDVLKGSQITGFSLMNSIVLTDFSFLGRLGLSSLSLSNVRIDTLQDIIPDTVEKLNLEDIAVSTSDVSREGSFKNGAELVEFSATGWLHPEYLEGLKLKEFSTNEFVLFEDLEVFRGMPLERLELSSNDLVRDFSSLKDAPLKFLKLSDFESIVDFTSLEGESLEKIQISNLPKLVNVDDLARLPLKEIRISGAPLLRDIGELGNIDFIHPLLELPCRLHLSQAGDTECRMIESK